MMSGPIVGQLCGGRNGETWKILNINFTVLFWHLDVFFCTLVYNLSEGFKAHLECCLVILTEATI